MADRPINLKQHEVKAVRAGRQTQLRRVIKPQPLAKVASLRKVATDNIGRPVFNGYDGRGRVIDGIVPAGAGCLGGEVIPHIAPGDRLWVRETWKPHSIYAGMKPRDIPKTNVFYRADDRYAPSNTPWIAAPQMPRWASRITLLVDEVRVQRLQSISEEDAVAEGAPNFASLGTVGGEDLAEASSKLRWPQRWFSDLWNSIHGPGAWDANPWVEVRTFRTVLANIEEGAR